MANSKGSRHERELARRLDAEGWSVIRSPASGSVDRDQPDLLATHQDRTPLAIESKYADETIYLSRPELAALSRFAVAFGARALVICRWKGDTRYYSRRGVSLPRTDADSGVAKHEVAREEDWRDGNLPNSVLGRGVSDA